MQVLRVVAGWLPVLPKAATSKILPILLHGAADELEQVQVASVELMELVRAPLSSLPCSRNPNPLPPKEQPFLES